MWSTALAWHDDCLYRLEEEGIAVPSPAGRRSSMSALRLRRGEEAVPQLVVPTREAGRMSTLPDSASGRPSAMN